MKDQKLFELADVILALSRQIHASKRFMGKWTPLESAVMRHIDANPGTTAGAAAEATQVISSNFSRALRALEQKGLVRKESDPADARRVYLYPTEQAQQNLQLLRATWSDLLRGTVDDPADVDRTIAVLRQIETRLNA